jgi:hypothetical protein
MGMILVVVSVGCGGGSDDEAGNATVPTETTAAGTIPATVATTVPATTAAPTTSAAPATTAPATTAATSSGGDAECMIGEWLADAAELQRGIDAIGVSFALTVGPDSFNRAVISDGTFVADSDVAVTGTLPGGIELTASGTSHLEGTYTTEGNVVRAEVVSSTGEIGEWTATLNGTEFPLPDDGSFGTPPIASADFNGSTFECTDTTLTFDVIDSEYGTITYTRDG